MEFFRRRNPAISLEAQSKNYGAGTVVGEETYEKTKSHFALLELDLIAVKGKSEAVRIYSLNGDKEMSESEDFREYRAKHGEMLAAYRSQRWDEAQALIAGLRLRKNSNQVLYDLYMERIAEYLINPPEPDWDGVYVAESK